jgi:uncharacterized protein
MEFDWDDSPATVGGLTTTEVEEAFEDPFGIRIMPDADTFAAREARYFALGRSISGRPVFSVFRTDGKRQHVILARPMAPAEESFYERKITEASSPP